MIEYKRVHVEGRDAIQVIRTFALPEGYRFLRENEKAVIAGDKYFDPGYGIWHDVIYSRNGAPASDYEFMIRKIDFAQFLEQFPHGVELQTRTS